MYACMVQSFDIANVMRHHVNKQVVIGLAFKMQADWSRAVKSLFWPGWLAGLFDVGRLAFPVASHFPDWTVLTLAKLTITNWLGPLEYNKQKVCRTTFQSYQMVK